MSIDQSYGEIFSVGVPFTQMILACVKLTKSNLCKAGGGTSIPLAQSQGWAETPRTFRFSYLAYITSLRCQAPPCGQDIFSWNTFKIFRALLLETPWPQRWGLTKNRLGVVLAFKADTLVPVVGAAGG